MKFIRCLPIRLTHAATKSGASKPHKMDFIPLVGVCVNRIGRIRWLRKLCHLNFQEQTKQEILFDEEKAAVAAVILTTWNH